MKIAPIRKTGYSGTSTKARKSSLQDTSSRVAAWQNVSKNGTLVSNRPRLRTDLAAARLVNLGAPVSHLHPHLLVSAEVVCSDTRWASSDAIQASLFCRGKATSACHGS